MTDARTETPTATSSAPAATAPAAPREVPRDEPDRRRGRFALDAGDAARVATFAALLAALGLPGSIALFGNAVPVTLQTLGVMLAGRSSARGAARSPSRPSSRSPRPGSPSSRAGAAASGVRRAVRRLPRRVLAGAAVVGLLVDRLRRVTFAPVLVACLVGGVAVVYAVGVPVQALVTGVPLPTTAQLSLVFLPGDVLKALAAAAITVGVVRAYPRPARPGARPAPTVPRPTTAPPPEHLRECPRARRPPGPDARRRPGGARPSRPAHARAVAHLRRARRGRARGATHLRASGTRPGDLVAVSLPDPLDLLTAVLAVDHLGATPLVCDAAWPRAHRAEVLRTLAPRTFVEVPLPRGTGTADGAQPVPPHVPGPDDLAWAGFSSGSTGRPRAVVRTRASWAGSFDAVTRLLGPDPRTRSSSPARSRRRCTASPPCTRSRWARASSSRAPRPRRRRRSRRATSCTRAAGPRRRARRRRRGRAVAAAARGRRRASLAPGARERRGPRRRRARVLRRRRAVVRRLRPRRVGAARVPGVDLAVRPRRRRASARCGCARRGCRGATSRALQDRCGATARGTPSETSPTRVRSRSCCAAGATARSSRAGRRSCPRTSRSCCGPCPGCATSSCSARRTAASGRS